eukprot:3270559-Amphidinium_carterae.1
MRPALEELGRLVEHREDGITVVIQHSVARADVQVIKGNPVLGQDATGCSEHETHLPLVWWQITLDVKTSAIQLVLRSTESVK